MVGSADVFSDPVSSLPGVGEKVYIYVGAAPNGLVLALVNLSRGQSRGRCAYRGRHRFG